MGRHPRGYGAFTRVIRNYVREAKILSMEEAIRKMTSLTADNLGIIKRGRIAVGQYADLVLFDPEKIADQATPEKPQLSSVGILTVWVNGKEVFATGKTTKVYPGKVIRRENN